MFLFLKFISGASIIVDQSTEAKERRIWNIAGFLLIAIFLGWAMSYPLVDGFYSAKAGTFGDSFGAINALFSGLAFLGVLVAVLLQKLQLQLQHQELEDTRLELKVQSKAFNQQNFENTFFSMLKVLREIVSDLNKHRPGYFEFINDYLPAHMSGRAIRSNQIGTILPMFNPQDDVSLEFEFVLFKAAELYELESARIGPYFRLIYNILKFVSFTKLADDSEDDFQAKKFYTNLVRAQLSNSELIALFYNGLTPVGLPLRKYMEQFAFLKHLLFPTLLHASHANILLHKGRTYSYNVYGFDGANIQKRIEAAGGGVLSS